MTTRGLGVGLLGVAAGLCCLCMSAIAQEGGAAPAAAAAFKPDTGDTAWMLTSSALVLMMTGPGLALFYCGLVRRKNVLGTMMQSFAMMAIISLQWFVVGYSLAFHDNNPKQLVNQLVATLATWVLAGVATFVILKIVDATIGLRVSEQAEIESLDLSQHGEVGYNL